MTKYHIGFFRYGKCWRWLALPQLKRFGNGVRFLVWGRFYLSWEQAE